jgi:uncharacterized surface protein with fasciclin (FAS1) repeats
MAQHHGERPVSTDVSRLNQRQHTQKGTSMYVKTRKVFAAAACSVALLGAAACGSSSNSSTTASSDKSSSSMSSPSKSSSSAMSDLVGPGCAGYAKAVPKGAGSVDGMAQDKVATAASNNPLLKTLVAAVSGKLNPKVNLVDALNGGEFTVFAPVDTAFAALQKKMGPSFKTLTTAKGAKTLQTVLTYHVVQGQLAPSAIAGSHKTLAGPALKVSGSGNNLKVNGVPVICGGVHTANATVYLIGSVLDPSTKGHF